MTHSELVGKSFTFEDGVKCEIVQIKRRDDGDWVTCHIHGSSVPRKMTMQYNHFVSEYGHLFELKEPPKHR